VAQKATCPLPETGHEEKVKEVHRVSPVYFVVEVRFKLLPKVAINVGGVSMLHEVIKDMLWNCRIWINTGTFSDPEKVYLVIMSIIRSHNTVVIANQKGPSWINTTQFYHAIRHEE
tara:strand:- start:885 stop:1232 length:348 start_codon:yes stop_codon:yes gene_type:complete